MNKFATVIAAIMVAAIGFFGWRKQKDNDTLDHDLAARRRGLSNPEIDPAFAHQITLDQQARESGAV